MSHMWKTNGETYWNSTNGKSEIMYWCDKCKFVQWYAVSNVIFPPKQFNLDAGVLSCEELIMREALG